MSTDNRTNEQSETPMYSVTYFCRNCRSHFVTWFKVGTRAADEVTHGLCGVKDSYKTGGDRD